MIPNSVTGDTASSLVVGTAKGMNLSNAELAELAELHDLILQRKVFPSGRSL